jgi:glycosyltransferase involved in cell wall biosynthesis
MSLARREATFGSGEFVLASRNQLTLKIWNDSLAVAPETLSVILPVANDQHGLVARLESLLERLSELTSNVQIVVVDDGSRDATAEVLEDLRCLYPQITSHRLAKSLGPALAVESALRLADGDFIFLHESYESIDLESLTQLWGLRHDRELVVARASTRRKRIDEPLMQRLNAWGKSLEEYWKRETKSLDERPLQMMKREAVESLSRIDPEQKSIEVSHLSQRRLIRANSPSHR